MEQTPEGTQQPPAKPARRRRRLASRRRLTYQDPETLESHEEPDSNDIPGATLQPHEASSSYDSAYSASWSLSPPSRPSPLLPKRLPTGFGPHSPAAEPSPPPLPPRAPSCPTTPRSKFPYFDTKKRNSGNSQQQEESKQIAQEQVENRQNQGRSSIFSSNPSRTTPSRAALKATIDKLRARSTEVLDRRSNEAPEVGSMPSTSRGQALDDRRTRQALTLPPTPTYPIQLPASMSHVIQHVFVKSTFILRGAYCDYCLRPIIRGFKCRECKYKCHNQCSPRVPPSCGLPRSIFDEVMKRVSVDALQAGLESSSTASSSENVTEGATAAAVTSVEEDESRAAIFVELDLPLRRLPGQLGGINEATLAPSPTADSERTLTSKKSTLSSQGSQESDQSSWCRKISSFGDWDIPFDELEMMEKIGAGRMGSVFKGQWHGYVAVKFINANDPEDNNSSSGSSSTKEKLLEDFKRDVRLFCQTRHENLVLFMGACMKPPHLALVMSYCKGDTLFTHIHKWRDRFPVSRAVLIGQQISQGMGYLHSRGIVHKDLNTKNIFLEKGRVVITDFGLFSMDKILDPRFVRHGIRDDILAIPRHWLCYLSPEIMRSLRVRQPDEDEPCIILPFTRASDVFAFGTIWYELISGKFPFDRQPAEVVIWQVARGVKYPLGNMDQVAPADVRALLLNCWAYYAAHRPAFADLLKLLERWPKERPKRSPSHPISLSRACQSVCN